MRKSKTVTIVWWPTSNREGDVPDGYQDALEESGFAHAAAMMAKGCASGDLSYNLRLGLDGEPENGLDFHGWWSFAAENS